MRDCDLTVMNIPLPDDIALLEGAGKLNAARELIRRRLELPITEPLRTRLSIERQFIEQTVRCYPLSEQTLMRQLRTRVRDFSQDEYNGLLDEGALDFIMVAGEKRFHEDTVSSLLKSHPRLNERASNPYDGHKSALNAAIARVKQNRLIFRNRIKCTLTINAFEPGSLYRIHLPLAACSMQQSGAEDIQASVPIISVDPEDAPQRTVLLQQAFSENTPVTLCYSYTQRPRYVDPMDESQRFIVYPDALPPCADDLAELPPHLTFSPLLRALASTLRGEETDPVRLARRFYDYITRHVAYAYQRPYLLIPQAAEYTALNLRGDCGLQALLFIALCRISGIPARWQSGLYAAPGDVGSHDWAEFYSPRLGWLPVDCSFGGTAYRFGENERWEFYFGNLDPYRMVANRAYFAPFLSGKRFPRRDPYDNQRGEAETDTRGLHDGEIASRYELLWHKELEVKK